MGQELRPLDRAILAAARDGARKSSDIDTKRIRAKASDRDAAIADLKTRGLLAEAGKDGRAARLELTDRGRDVAASIEAPVVPPPRARARAAPDRTEPFRELQSALERGLALVGERLDRIERLLGARQLAPEPDALALSDTILQSISALDAAHRYNGIVPLPDLRAELQRRGCRVADTEVDRALEGLERDDRVDLMVAQAPHAVPHPSAGIHLPGRGLIYYVGRRGVS
jgi:hypothetical protein